MLELTAEADTEEVWGDFCFFKCLCLPVVSAQQLFNQ